MTDELLAVQFPHPGGEHRPGPDGSQGWNLRRHHRKFMKTPGLWRTSAALNEGETRGEIMFWGEWEPPSQAIDELSRPDRRYPRYVVEPILAEPPDSPDTQNTDPFVFGDRFLYSNCRQNTKRGPLRTQRLAPGSMVLFGSSVKGEFVVDTVFVVARSQALTVDTAPDMDMSNAFATATMDLLFPRHQDLDFRLYEGATPSDPITGMFSFVPCIPYEDPPRGFPRPAIHLGGVVNQRNRQGLKYTGVPSLVEMRQLWEQVAEQVLDEGLALAVHIDEPGQ